MIIGQSDTGTSLSPASLSPQVGANVFRREGEYWTVVYLGQVCRLRDTRGLRLLQYLLSHPGSRVQSLALLDVAIPGRSGRPSSDGVNAKQRNEQARVNATRAIRGAIQRLGLHHPALGDHLAATVRTGSSCVYQPDPRVPIVWEM